MKPRLHTIAIGGRHQFFHFLPAAFELARRGNCDAVIFVPNVNAEAAVQRLAQDLDLPCPPIIALTLPGPLEWLAERMPPSFTKMLRLLVHARRLRAADMLLSAERTSTLLKRLPGACPTFVHIPHGAGDRAVGFERRLALFDRIITIGQKDCERMIAAGVAHRDKVQAGGSVKLATVARLPAPRPLFNNDRPTVLYNPHFSADLGSFNAVAQRLIEQVSVSGRYNLVVAPHLRLAENWSRERITKWEAKSQSGSLIVDMGSERSVNMNYTLGADIYFGDVSSQVYEFAFHPRPCVFVNSHKLDWEGDPNYAMWKFGPVVDPDADFVAAIDDAIATHANYAKEQRDRTTYALGLGPDDGVDAIDRVADLLENMLL